jgi:hypothetical protein
MGGFALCRESGFVSRQPCPRHDINVDFGAPNLHAKPARMDARSSHCPRFIADELREAGGVRASFRQ